MKVNLGVVVLTILFLLAIVVGCQPITSQPVEPGTTSLLPPEPPRVVEPEGIPTLETAQKSTPQPLHLDYWAMSEELWKQWEIGDPLPVLPNGQSAYGWPKDPWKVEWLTWPRTIFEGCSKVFRIGWDDTFSYEGDRGLVGLRNPTYSELMNFLALDKTDEQEAIPPKVKGIGDEEMFICHHFATMLREDANKVGFRCAFLSISFYPDNGHALNAFETTNRGIIWIEPQSDEERKPCFSREDLFEIPPPGVSLNYVVYIW